MSCTTMIARARCSRLSIRPACRVPPVSNAAAWSRDLSPSRWRCLGDGGGQHYCPASALELFRSFLLRRYPQLTFHFRNSGVGGDTIPKVLARYDWDVAPWKPTVVSVELGMNDKGGFPVDKYIANMGELNDKIKAGNARAVYFTASPINNGDTSSKLGGNASLDAYAVALRKFAAEKNAPYADQFHALIDVWGNNKPRENVASLTASIQGAIRDKNIKGIEHLQAFLTEQAQDPNPPVSMLGDPVHPGSVGQLMMATALLQALGADNSSAV